MKTLKLIIISLLVVFSFYSCKKNCCQDPTNPECENYDPCYGLQEANADFVIEENVNGRYFIGDSVGGINLHRFRALHDADSFVWKLGAETIRAKQFERRFFPNDQWLDVQLIVYKKANSKCEKKQKISDTLKKRFYSWDMDTRNADGIPKMPVPIKGYFKGYYESNKDQAVFVYMRDSIYYNKLGERYIELGIKGFPLPNSNPLTLGSADWISGVFSHFINAQYGIGGFGTNIPPFKSFMYLDRYNRDKITIEVSYRDTLSNVWKEDKFIGFRKN